MGMIGRKVWLLIPQLLYIAPLGVMIWEGGKGNDGKEAMDVYRDVDCR